jgi:hypothetical protein
MAKATETAAQGASETASKSRAKPRSSRAKGAAGTLARAAKEANRPLAALCDRLEGAGDSDAPLREFATELMIQTTVKEQVLYPALQSAGVPEEMIDEARVRNDLAGFMLRDLMAGNGDDPFRHAKAGVLAQMVKHQITLEEKPRDGLLARAQGGASADLAARIKERREALEAQAKSGALEPEPAATFHRQSGAARRPGEESTMPQHGPERDERGRFMSQDDDGRYGQRGGRGGGRGRMDDDDDRGRSYQSRGRSRDDDDDDRRGRDHGQGGWFGDPRGHSQASRMGWDERRRQGSDRGESGWFGDPEGHSEASRRGWQSRYREGTEHESGWHGDPEGHSEASRRGWQTRYREGTEHESGWHGDPEGHSRASRMGWEHRRHEGTDRFYDDDNRRGGSRASSGGYGGGGYGGRGQEGGYGGGRGSQGREHDRGQGGWFGDSEGHSEASRRGWESRRHDDDDDYRGSRRR